MEKNGWIFSLFRYPNRNPPQPSSDPRRSSAKYYIAYFVNLRIRRTTGFSGIYRARNKRAGDETPSPSTDIMFSYA